MTVPEKVLWKNWADQLRQEMMTGLEKQVTKTIDEILRETETTKAERTLRSERFWFACQAGEKPNDFLTRGGFDIEYEQNEKKQVDSVTFTLNKSWSRILQRVVDRQELKQSAPQPRKTTTARAKADAEEKSHAN
jgi:hypothetical protein